MEKKAKPPGAAASTTESFLEWLERRLGEEVRGLLGHGESRPGASRERRRGEDVRRETVGLVALVAEILSDGAPRRLLPGRLKRLERTSARLAKEVAPYAGTVPAAKGRGAALAVAAWYYEVKVSTIRHRCASAAGRARPGPRS